MTKKTEKKILREIIIRDKEIIAETITQQIEGTIDGKEFTAVRTKGFQRNIGETDNDFSFDFEDELTDKEKEDIENFIQGEVTW